MKKNSAFVNLFLSEGLQNCLKCRAQPKKNEVKMLYFSGLEATAWKKRNFVTQIS